MYLTLTLNDLNLKKKLKLATIFCDFINLSYIRFRETNTTTGEPVWQKTEQRDGWRDGHAHIIKFMGWDAQQQPNGMRQLHYVE